MATTTKRQTNVVRRSDIPAWAERIVVIGNGIDGYPPRVSGCYEVDEFLKLWPKVRGLWGGGEWDVTVYAARGACYYRHPFGRENPYRVLRASKGWQESPIGQVAGIVHYDYMEDVQRGDAIENLKW